jgi:tetratricopeptide (TPR) repeat protein
MTTDPKVADGTPRGEITEPGRPSAIKAPIVEGWDRYEILGQLGRGGMGIVYRARDLRDPGQRLVAIKFVLETDEKTTQRFLREASAQARIIHPNVCPVHEVDEVNGRAYIAMQLIDGAPIHQAAREMSIDERVAAIRDVAVAVHEAHKIGIVHRDLKPANILVQHTQERGWCPYVMDFGLAREMSTDAEISDSGIAVGTPAYMPPEQAFGNARVDRRADVYALGATLYELMTGQPPFNAASVPAIMSQLANAEPPPPRAIVPSLPVDLETIALRCLEKAPHRRYPSARALADDLTRYLDGAPIHTRRPSALRRASTKVRNSRGLAAAIGVLAGVTCLATALGIHTCIEEERQATRAQERARVADRVGRAAQRVESDLREAYLRPIHDLRIDRDLAHERMRAIRAELGDVDDPGAACVHAALGRAHLALREWPQAAAEIRAAQALGLDTPETHVELGRALGEIYLASLGDLGRSSDERPGVQSWVSSRRAQAAVDYLTPAEVEIGRGIAPIGSDLLRARLALYARDFTTAEQLARRIPAVDPSAAEALEVAGDAAALSAAALMDRGELDTAAPVIRRAAETYEQAGPIARSDGHVHRAAAEAWIQVAEIEERKERPISQEIDRAVTLLQEDALIVDPDDATAYADLACARMISYRRNTDPEQDSMMIAQINAAADRAVQISPQSPRTAIALALALTYHGIFQFRHGGAGTPSWRTAISTLKHAESLRPDDPRVHNITGYDHRWISEEMERNGEDPSEEFHEAKNAYEEALKIDPTYFKACVNQTDLLVFTAEHERDANRDPTPHDQEAEKIGSQCLRTSPNSNVILDALSRGQNAVAEHALQSDTDPRSALKHARELLNRSVPPHIEEHAQRAISYRIEAQYLISHHQDATSIIRHARTVIDETIKMNPMISKALVEAAKIQIIEGDLDSARESAEKAIAVDPRSPDAHLVSSQVCIQIRASKCAVDQANIAMKINPSLPHLRQTIDEALMISGRSAAKR